MKSYSVNKSEQFEGLWTYRVSIQSFILYKSNNSKPWKITENLFIIYETTMKQVCYFNGYFLSGVSHRKWLLHLKKPTVCTGKLSQENQR
jgi:phosphomevalonate kinase